MKNIKEQLEEVIKKKHNELFKIDYNMDYNTKLNLQRKILEDLANEVLKVVVDKIEDIYFDCDDRGHPEDFFKKIQLLTNSSTLDGEQSEHLSPNKENE